MRLNVTLTDIKELQASFSYVYNELVRAPYLNVPMNNVIVPFNPILACLQCKGRNHVQV